MTTPLARTLLIALVVTFRATPGLHAQATVPMRAEPELRGDLLLGQRAAVQAGAGIQVPFGYYVRIGADAALGARTGAVDGSRLDGRVDLLGRFLLDPFRQSAYGFSAGAGLSARLEPGERVTPLLLVALELEGRRPMSGWTPAVQLGLAGGARIGLVLRRGLADAR